MSDDANSSYNGLDSVDEDDGDAFYNHNRKKKPSNKKANRKSNASSDSAISSTFKSSEGGSTYF